MEPDNNNNNSWHLDKRISISTLVAIAVQLVFLVTFATNINWRVETLEAQNVTDRRVAVVEQHVITLDKNIDRLENRTLTALESISLKLERIEKRLDERRN